MRYAGAITVLVALVIFAAGVGVALAADPPEGLPTGKADSKISPLLEGLIDGSLPSARKPPQDSQTQALEEPRGLSRDIARQSLAPDQPTLTIPRSSALPSLEIDDRRDGGPQLDEPVRFDTSARVQVYVYVNGARSGDITVLKDRGLLVELVNEEDGIVQGWTAAGDITAIAELDFVRRISLPDYAIPQAGSVTSEGDLISRTGLLRGVSGLTGAGVKVGVISDGVNARATAQFTGDLPAVLDIDPDRPGYGHEGTALLEIVHDLAPGSRLAFSGPSTSLEMVESIRYLAHGAFDGSGVDIIVDDLGFFGEPYYADGMVARAAKEAVDGGVVFVSSAGNSGNKHYEGSYTAGGVGPDNVGSYHAFAANDDTLSVTVREGSVILLQWNEEFGASSNDYDLYLCNRGFEPTVYNLNNGLCLGSGRTQDGTGIPFEGIYLPPSSPPNPNRFGMDIFIHAYAVSANPAGSLKLFVLGGTVDEYGTPAGSIFGHAALPRVIAVGAIDASDPENNDIEGFSSQGPTQIYFPTEQSRPKPDVVSIDGVAITGSGNFSNPFFGTSAASPHVAGIAALVLEADRQAHPGSHRQAAAQRVFDRIRNTAYDLGDAGFDNVFGAGRADGLAAVQDLGLLAPLVLTVDSTGDGADGDTGDGVCGDGDGACTLRAAIEQANAAGGGIIKFDIASTTPHTIQPGSALPVISSAVVVDGQSQAPSADGGADALVQIEIDGSNAGAAVDGLVFSGSAGEIRRLAINRFGGHGIVLQGSGPVAVEDSLIGTGTTGETDLGNGGAGISVTTAGNSIARNTISGNGSHGISISGSSARRTFVSGNYIGTDADGESDLGNDGSGVNVSGAPGAQIKENIISGNTGQGIDVSGGTAAEILDNIIGFDVTGSVDLGNDGAGLSIVSASAGYVVGNTISGNGSYGVNVEGSSGASGNIFGINSVTDNDDHGIRLNGAGVTDTLVRLNVIGTDAGGNTDQGNGGSGVHIGGGASRNRIDFNSIAFSGGDGVTVVSDSASRNTVWENSIYSNTGLGIDLGDDGVTPNDVVGDGDSGSNDLQNFPVLSVSAKNDSVIGVYGSINGPGNTAYTIDFYSSSGCDASSNGEGEAWLGYKGVTTSFFGSADIDGHFLATGVVGPYITATATDPSGNTSEFSSCVTATTLVDLDLPNGIDVDEGGTTSYDVKLAADPGAGVTVTVFLFSNDEKVATTTPTSLGFTTGNWDTAQTVPVTGIQDDDASDGNTSILQLVVDGGNTYIAGVVGVRVADDDLPELTLPAGPVIVAEGGTANYTMKLAAQPAADVTVSIAVAGDTGAVTLSSTGHTFTSSNWNTAYTITANGVADDDASNQFLRLDHSVTLGGENHVLGRLSIVVVDDDLPQLTLNPDSLSVEEGATADYTAALDAAPAADLKVSLMSGDPGAVTTVQGSITFSTSTAQTLSAGGVVDDDGLDETVEVFHNATIGDRPYLLGTLTVNVSDSDTAPYFLEGATATRSIMETATPGTDVGLPLTALDPDGGAVSYSLAGADSGPFNIDSANGRISLARGASLDYENPTDQNGDNDYEVTVSVIDAGSETDSKGLTISVLDDSDDTADYPPEAPTGLAIRATDSGSDTKLSLLWAAPGNKGRTPTTDHDVRYRPDNSPDWTLIDYTPIADQSVVLEDLNEDVNYQVQVRARNAIGAGGWSIFNSAATGTPDNDAPYFSEGRTASRTIDDGSLYSVNLGPPVTATDADPGDTLTYSLSGPGHEDFEIDSSGQISVANMKVMDFESQSYYPITVSVHDGGDANGNTDTTVDDELELAISVRNVEEAGEVTFSWNQAQVDTELVAEFADPDGGVTNLSWEWAASPDGSTGWTLITGATTESYTPEAASVGNYLRATASYDDAEGTGKTAEAVTDSPVHRAPEFTEGATATRSIPEATQPGANIGSTLTATDEGGDTLAYTLSGSDDTLFDVNIYDGRLTVGGTTTLDFENPGSFDSDNIYEVTVTAAEISPYDRGNWDHWTDADNDCQNTRDEVLIAESSVAVTLSVDGCRVVTGEWAGAFTGTPVTQVTSLAIDHFVPLANAWKSGGWAWDEAKKRGYANYLEDAGHLVAVTASANLSKGASGPEEWKPSLASFHCEYATRWTKIKSRWGLAVTAAEQAALNEMIATCVTPPALPALTSAGPAEAGQGGSATIDVTITVTDVNEPPEAANDNATVTEDASVTVDVLSNDSDPDDGDTIRITHISVNPEHGTASPQLSEGTITYTPNPDYTGTDSFEYTISDRLDGTGLTNAATVSVVVYLPVETMANTQATGLISPGISVKVGSPDGFQTVEFAEVAPEDEPFQVLVDFSVQDCSTPVPGGTVVQCVSVDIFDIEADPVVIDPETPFPTATIRVEVSGTGDVSVHKRNAPGSEWRSIPACTPTSESECFRASGDVIVVENIRGFSQYSFTRTRVEPSPRQTDGDGGDSAPPAFLPPVFAEGTSALREVAEHSSAGTRVGAPITATDTRGRTVTYSKSGPDATLFDVVSATGQVLVAPGADLDYEPMGKTYTIVVVATTGVAAPSEITVRINVTNVDEPGRLDLSTDGPPEAGAKITATLVDPDGRVTGQRWQWQRSSDGVTWTDIAEAVSESYTPGLTDVGVRLRVSVTYDDAFGVGVTLVDRLPWPISGKPTPEPAQPPTPGPTAGPTAEPTVPATPVPTATPLLLPTLVPTATPVPTPVPAATSRPPTPTLQAQVRVNPTALPPVAAPMPTPLPAAAAKPTSTPVASFTGPRTPLATVPTSTPVAVASLTVGPTPSPVPIVAPSVPSSGANTPVWVIVIVVAGVLASTALIVYRLRRRFLNTTR